MPRYYFHQHHQGDLIEDPEGQDFPDIDAARGEAVLAAREITADRLTRGAEPDHSRFEITNDEGRVLAKVEFQDVLQGRASVDAEHRTKAEIS